jgi:hypothetical protein
MSRPASQTASTLFALLLANVRYWTTVAPRMRKQLVRWEIEADAIPDRRRRALASVKLREERFNVELAATLATLAPRARRRAVTDAIVAVQVAYDYHDALNERALSFDDDRHLARLARAARVTLAGLPAAPAVEPAIEEAIARCAQAQALAHAGAEEEIERWAADRARNTGLAWPELLAGAQASVLCVHALIAAAADRRTTREQAARLDALYLRIGALTMLDSLIDREQDAARGERGYLARYGDAGLMAARLAVVAAQARHMARTVPHGSHHLVTMAGIAACYGSAPAAAEPQAGPVFAAVRRELGFALTAPTLALMRIWRLYKRVTLSSSGVTQPHPRARLRAHGVR